MIEADPKLIDLTKQIPKDQPTLRYETDAEVFELFPEPEPQPKPERKPADIIRLADHQVPKSEIIRYNEAAKMYEFPGLS